METLRRERDIYYPHDDRFPWWFRAKRICLQCRIPRLDAWVGKIPWRREWQPTPVFLPGELHGQRNLVGYSPWGRKESDMTERLTHTHTQSWIQRELDCLQHLPIAFAEQKTKTNKKALWTFEAGFAVWLCAEDEKHWIQKQMKRKTDLDSTTVLGLVSSRANCGFSVSPHGFWENYNAWHTWNICYKVHNMVSLFFNTIITTVRIIISTMLGTESFLNKS